ncbi:hypothetical protein Tco_1225363 [Tanacetum coccineum]
MFEVSIILEDDSAELMSGGANRFVNVTTNSATSSFCSTCVELIGEFVALMFGEVLREGASLSMKVENEEALVESDVSRVAAEIGVRIYQKSQETEEYKRAKDSKPKSKEVNSSQLWVNRSQLIRRQIPNVTQIVPQVSKITQMVPKPKWAIPRSKSPKP